MGKIFFQSVKKSFIFKMKYSTTYCIVSEILFSVLLPELFSGPLHRQSFLGEFVSHSCVSKSSFVKIFSVASFKISTRSTGELIPELTEFAVLMFIGSIWAVMWLTRFLFGSFATIRRTNLLLLLDKLIDEGFKDSNGLKRNLFLPIFSSSIIRGFLFGGGPSSSPEKVDVLRKFSLTM